MKSHDSPTERLPRYANPAYAEFEAVFRAAKADLNPMTKAALRGFDFDFGGWPVEYKVGAGWSPLILNLLLNYLCI